MMTTMTGAATGNDETQIRALLAHLGTAMIATGQPAQEVEEELSEVGVRLGYGTSDARARLTVGLK